MAKYYTALETEDGEVHIVTRSRWLFLFPMPYTSVLPHRRADITRLGTFIRWESASNLNTCHEAVIHLVKERGLFGVADIAASEKRNAKVAKKMGMSYRELIDEATKSRAPIPDLDNVLRHIKGFM